MFAGMKNIRKKPSELRETFRISITEGVFSQIYTGLAGPGSVFLTRLLTLLGASSVHFGILSATGQLSMVLQPLGALVTRRMTHHRRSTVLWAAAGRMMTPLLGLVPLVFQRGQALTGVLVVFAVSTAVLSVSTNIWTGWIARMVPLRIRGRFFARRNSILVVFGLAVAFLVGMVVDGTDGDPERLKWVFLVVFSVAGVIGLTGLRILSRQPERAVPPTPCHPGKFSWSFRTKLQKTASLRCVVDDGGGNRRALLAALHDTGASDGGNQHAPLRRNEHRGNRSHTEVLGKAGGQVRQCCRHETGDNDRNSGPPCLAFRGPEDTWIIYAESVVSGSMWGCVGIVTANLVLAVAPEDRVQSYSGLYGAFSGTGMIITMLASGF